MSGLHGVAWEDLAVLLAALDEGSLNAAARTLHIGQSTASRRLVRLERMLGSRLFDRTPEGLRPTAFAEELAPHARLIGDHMADIDRLASGQEVLPRGRVRLALPDGLGSAFVVPRLQSFFDAYPEVEVDLAIGHAVLDLVRREADLALRFIRPTAPELVVAKVAHLRMLPYVHPDLAGQPPENLRWVVFDDPTSKFHETRWVRDHIKPARTLRTSLWHALFTAAVQGVGPALLSPVVAEPAGLVPLEGLPPCEGRDLYLVYHQALRDVPRVAAVRQWLVEQASFFEDL